MTVVNSLRNNWDLVLSGLLRCVYDVNFLEKYSQFIKPKYMYEGDTDNRAAAMRKMFTLVVDIYAQRRHKDLLGSVLSFEQEVLKFGDGEILDECRAIVKRFLDTTDKVYLMATDTKCESQFLDYLKMTRIREWTQEFNGPWKSGNMVEAQKTLDTLTNTLRLLDKRDVDELKSDSIYSFLENMNVRTYKNFRIGIPELDQDNGWIEPETLNLFAAPPGRGKSMMANTIIRLAILQGKHVHITVVENRKENFVPRMVASLTGISIYDLKNNFGSLSSEKQKLIRVMEGLITTYVTASFMYGQGIEAVHSHKIEHDNLRKMDGKPPIDIDIIDYTGHIVHYSGNGTDPMHTRFRNAYAMRKDFALLTKKICFDFVQINREGTRKNDSGGAAMIGMNDLATSFDLAQVCDTMISININSYDSDAKEAKLYVAKGREGGLGSEILVKTHFMYGRFGMNYKNAQLEGAAMVPVERAGLTAELVDAKAEVLDTVEAVPSNVTQFPKGGKS